MVGYMFGKNKVAVALAMSAAFAYAENPLIQTYYSPDPAPVVFGDTLCTYSGNDEGGSFFTMHGWRVSCTTDMVNWTDMNTLILEAGDFNGSAKKNGDWASQCIRRNDKYYYYVTVESTRGGRAVNVAVSDKKEGPFKDALNGKHLAGPNWDYIDPTVFIDDDGQAWLYWGNPKLYYCPLKENMIECASEIKVSDMSTFNGKYTEGPWIHKRGKKYYMIYAAGGIPESIDYSWSDSPTGPWTYKGVIMPSSEPGAAFTVHSGIVDFKGRSFFFYHNQKNVKGGGYSRSTAIEEFTWNADGTIPTIRATNNGVVKPIKNLDPFVRVEAETKAWVGGMTVNTSGGYTIIEHVGAEYGNVFLTKMNSGFYTKVRSVDMGDGADRIIVCTRGNGGKLELHAGSENGALLASMNIPSSSAWEEHTFDVTDAAGVDDLFFVVKQGGFDFDYWYMESEKTAVPQTAYNDKPATIPGKIEAENYDVGGHNKAFYDNDRENQGKVYREDEVDVVALDESCTTAGQCEFAIGYTQTGEWLEYTVNVTAAGDYPLTARVASGSNASSFILSVDDKVVSDTIKVPAGEDWDTYSEVEAGKVTLSAGEHVIRLTITGDYANIDWVRIGADTTTALKDRVAFGANAGTGIAAGLIKVFDMQGRYMGTVRVGYMARSGLPEVLRMYGYDSGVYFVRTVDGKNLKINTAEF